ncbi:MAG: hypothetical protein ACXVLQ_00760 [Bacteriovorax sp.]
MGGLISGLLGGGIISGSMVFGSLLALMQSSSSREEEFIEGKMELVLSMAFFATALSFIHPAFEAIYRGSFSGNSEMWSLMLVLVLAVFIVSLSRHFISKSVVSAAALNSDTEQLAATTLLFITLKNIPGGLIAGASMNIAHTGLSYSLMTGIAMHSLLKGMIAAQCFLLLGLDSALAFVGVMFISLIGFVAGVLGGYMSKEVLGLMPFLMAFASGTMLEATVHQISNKIKIESRRRLLNPSLVSGIIVTLLFILWRGLSG